jgi:Gas vesicle synthesis protein GvpL/GvpF
MLGERNGELRETLERVRGHVELGVKAWVDLPTLEQTLGADEQPVERGAGAAYLQQRRREQELSRELSARCSALAEEAHGRLALVAVAAVSNRPQPRELTGRSEPMMLNGAYLVRQDDERLRDEVRQLTEEHASLGVEYEVTGPWPPHNFSGGLE